MRYSIDELADLGGVSRRTVRYYIQESLIPPPYGVGRGPHYGGAHLDALLKVKALQEAGRTLDDIRRLAKNDSGAPRGRSGPRLGAPPVSRSLWRRFGLAPGVELHVAGGVRLPQGAALEELAQWCRTYLVPTETDEEN